MKCKLLMSLHKKTNNLMMWANLSNGSAIIQKQIPKMTMTKCSEDDDDEDDDEDIDDEEDRDEDDEC